MNDDIKDEMKDILKTVQCQIVIPEVAGLKDQEITVGRHFILNCQGDWDKSFDFTKAKFEFADIKLNTMLKVIKVEARDTTSFDIDMVSYVAGESKFESLIISDSTSKISLGAQKFNVVSVLPKPEEQQLNEQGQPLPPKPFGYAVGEVSWPYLYIILIFLVFLSLIILFVRRFQVRQKIKSYQSLVASYESAISPDNQFYKKMRTLEKSDYPLPDLDQAIKIYLMRTFQLPFLNLNPSVLFRLMVKKYPRDKKIIKSIDLILKDLELFKKSTDVTTGQKTKLVNQFYTVMIQCEALRQRKTSAKGSV